METARGLVEGTVDVGDGVGGEGEEVGEILDVVLSCAEDYCRVGGGGFVCLGAFGVAVPFAFLAFVGGFGGGGGGWGGGALGDFDDVLKKVEECTFFLGGFDGEEGGFEVLGDFGVGVEADEGGFLEAGFGELDE